MSMRVDIERGSRLSPARGEHKHVVEIAKLLSKIMDEKRGRRSNPCVPKQQCGTIGYLPCFRKLVYVIDVKEEYFINFSSSIRLIVAFPSHSKFWWPIENLYIHSIGSNSDFEESNADYLFYTTPRSEWAVPCHSSWDCLQFWDSVFPRWACPVTFFIRPPMSRKQHLCLRGISSVQLWFVLSCAWRSFSHGTNRLSLIHI